MFVLTTNPTFVHAVKVRVPIDGGFRDEDFRAKFRVIPTDEIAKFDLSEAAGSSDFLRAAIAETYDVVDAANQAVPYSDELRDQLINVPFVRAGFVSAYFDGVGAAKRGN